MWYFYGSNAVTIDFTIWTLQLLQKHYYKSNRDSGMDPLSRLAFVVIDLQKFCQFV